MANTMVKMTRDPLADGVELVGWENHRGRCRTCCDASPGISIGPPGMTPFTRSVEPDANGQYVIQFHAGWCPVFTGETPELPCPRCGAPIEGHHLARGVIYTVPGAGPDGDDGHIMVEGGGETHGRIVPAEYVPTAREPWPDGDRLTVIPCRHTLLGDEAHEVLRKAAEIRAHLRAAEHEATIAASADLLTAAETAGHTGLAIAYRDAVRQDDATALGLLTAIRVLMEA